MSIPAVIFADRTGVIRRWSPGMTDLVGFSEAEALGATLDLIVPPDYREHHWIGYRAAMELADGARPRWRSTCRRFTRTDRRSGARST